MGIATSLTGRRQLLGVAALALPALALADVGANAQATPTDEDGQRVAAPVWSFGVLHVHDPYAGTMQFPQAAPAGTRYVAAEVEIDNASDQPLAFTPAEIRLRDEAGTEYRGGSALGTEPSVNPRNLNGGERSHGWVWFTVPAGVRAVQLVYVGPQPEFRVDLAG